MKRVTLLCRLTVAVAVLTFFPADVEGQSSDLAFKKGKFSTVVSAVVIRGERDEHRFGAKAGQRITIAIAALEDNAVFQLSYKKGGKWHAVAGTEEGKDARVWYGALPKSESNQYVIVVGGTRGNASYDLFVGISSAELLP